eukprot:scaffold75624_cov84-Cyclotella_meneghiniana.AAC.3
MVLRYFQFGRGVRRVAIDDLLVACFLHSTVVVFGRLLTSARSARRGDVNKSTCSRRGGSLRFRPRNGHLTVRSSHSQRQPKIIGRYWEIQIFEKRI